MQNRLPINQNISLYSINRNLYSGVLALTQGTFTEISQKCWTLAVNCQEHGCI